MIRWLAALIITLATANWSFAQSFDVVVLGATGGIQDGNLSAFMITPAGDENGVTCDAGSIVNGIRTGVEKGAFEHIRVPENSPYNKTGYILTQNIKGYLISHAHLDHVTGLIIASPDDSKKPIYALKSVTDKMAATHFNWQAWPNFGNSGKAPQLGKYNYQDLVPGKNTQISNTQLQVTAYPLAHGGQESTAFSIENKGDILLCFGDTGPDSVNKSGLLHNVWTSVADKARNGRLKAVIIESSYDSSRPDKLLFGHLTPKHVLQEFEKLAGLIGNREALRGLPVLISHIKYSLKKGETPQTIIERQLNEHNTLGLKFIIPKQGMRLQF